MIPGYFYDLESLYMMYSQDKLRYRKRGNKMTEERKYSIMIEELRAERVRLSGLLDKIRAEMDGLLNDEDNLMYAHGVMDCLEIIDEYRTEK